MYNINPLNTGMTTLWTLPTQFTQYVEEGGETFHISWNASNNFNELRNLDNRSLQSMGNLIHTARSPKIDIKNKTYYVRATGFNFVNLPTVVSGIELRLTSRRYGRATDDTIELCLNEQSISDNLATLEINPQKIYGGPTDTWGIENLNLTTVQDSTFGVIFRFQAHPDWPHKDPVLVDSVELRIH